LQPPGLEKGYAGSDSIAKAQLIAYEQIRLIEDAETMAGRLMI
jgi:hypothetical protein